MVPEMQPSWDLSWELVRLAGRDQIVASFVAGRMRLYRGWPVDWDGPALMRQARRERRAGGCRRPDPSRAPHVPAAPVAVLTMAAWATPVFAILSGSVCLV